MEAEEERLGECGGVCGEVGGTVPTFVLCDRSVRTVLYFIRTAFPAFQPHRVGIEGWSAVCGMRMLRLVHTSM